jgi:hypothetical protein
VFTQRNIHKYTWTSPDGEKTQIDYVLMGIKDGIQVWLMYFSEGLTNAEYYQEAAKVREILSVSIRLKSPTGFQLLKAWMMMMMWTSKGLWEVLDTATEILGYYELIQRQA